MDPASEDVQATSDSNSQQQLQDIQSYLATFNKEIGDGSGGVSTTANIPRQQVFVQASSTDNTHQIFTNADVQSLIQQGTNEQEGQDVTIISQNDAETQQNIGIVPVSIKAQGLQSIPILPLSAQQMIIGNQVNQQAELMQTIGQTGSIVIDNTNQSLKQDHNDDDDDDDEDQTHTSTLLSAGNSYQTVTIVPTSEVNQSGEVSYVLIVSQPEDDKGNNDMSVFDFKEEKAGTGTGIGDATLEEDEDMEEDLSEAKKSAAHIKFSAANRPITQLMCNYCNYTSAKRYLLTRHMKTHSEERPHKCNICDRGFKTVASLQNHINTHTGVKPHKCKECDATFTTSGELVRHVRYKHTFEKPHKCPDCDYASVELSKLKRHIRSHTGERPYQCPHCSYASPDTYKLKRHLRIHTGEKPYECDICHARFTQSNSMKSHRLIHTGEKPVFQCELCPTTCGRKTDLKNHVIKLHSSEKPIPCKKCGKSFPDRYTYKMHIKTHDGEKCFICELCPYAAMSQRHLESHILTHTGEKPFQCDECDMTFRQKQLLRRHKNLYHTPDYTPPAPREKQHQCVECGKTFAHRGNMLRHMALHDPDNPLYQEINIMKVEEEEEEARQAMEMEVMEEEPCDDDIPEGEPDENYSHQAPRQVQVQLVNEDGEHAGQIYLQLENPDGTIPEGEPVPVGGPVPVSDMNIEYTQNELVPEQHTITTKIENEHVGLPRHQIVTSIPEGEYEPGEIPSQHIIVTHNQAEAVEGLVQCEGVINTSFGFTQQEGGIPPGEH